MSDQPQSQATSSPSKNEAPTPVETPRGAGPVSSPVTPAPIAGIAMLTPLVTTPPSGMQMPEPSSPHAKAQVAEAAERMIPNPFAGAAPAAATSPPAKSAATAPAVSAPATSSSNAMAPLPTGVMPRPSSVSRGGQQPAVKEQPIALVVAKPTEKKANEPSQTSMPAQPQPQPQTQTQTQTQTEKPVIASKVPKMEDVQTTGPITKKQRAFFASPPRVEVSAPRAITPIVPLKQPTVPPGLRKSEKIEMSGGVVVIERTSPAWIATALVAAAGLIIALVLALDATAAKEELAKKEGEVAELTKKVTELETIPKVAASTATSTVAPPVTIPPTASSEKQPDLKPLVDAIRARIPGEVTRGEAKVVIEDGRVSIVLDGMLEKKGKLSKKAGDVLGRVGAALTDVEKIDVIAYSDGPVGRGRSEWGQSAARATNIARSLAATVDPKKMAVVGRGAPPKGVKGSRVELVITK